MNAVQAKLLTFLNKSPQFIIPIYQRTYSWTEKQCKQLWDDIIRTGSSSSISAHFVGSIVYVQQGLNLIVNQSPLLVIDGQQRLATIMLLIEALARRVGESEVIESLSATKLRNYYLLNSLEKGERRYKLLLSQTDKPSLLALLDGAPRPMAYSNRIEANFELFQKWLAQSQVDLTALWSGINKLMIVEIALDLHQDNPQLIFESLNSTGLALSQADLIRNFILMGLEPEIQTRLYEHYWHPMEQEFSQEAYASSFDGFMRHYLTVKTGRIPKEGEVYEEFKRFAGTPDAKGFESLLSDIRIFAGYYCAMALGAETRPELKEAFQDLQELRVDVAFPLLLELYDDFKNGRLSSSDLLATVRLIESYVFRRAVCGILPNSLNKTFATFARGLNKERYLESVQAGFLQQTSYRQFPTDGEFVQNFQVKDLYNFRSKTYWLRRFENYGRKEAVSVNQYAIEHIMPQNEDLSEEWRTDIGPDWERIHKTYLHMLGNLTLTGYNSEYSDRPFLEKRDMEGGFSHSPLRLNQGLGQLEKWNEDSIRQRAQRLAKEALEVWISPRLSAGNNLNLLYDLRQKNDDDSFDEQRIPANPESSTRRIRSSQCDTIIVPAWPDNFQKAFIEHRHWHEIRISPEMKDKIKYIGAYQTAPISAVTHVAEVAEIKPYKDTGKYELVFKGAAREINHVPCSGRSAPQGPVYAIYERLLTAKSLNDAKGEDEDSDATKTISLDEVELRRQRFWTQLLALAKEKTDLHAHISPGVNHWVSVSRRGMNFNYVILRHDAAIELYIDRGKDMDEENKSIFDQLLNNKVTIEKSFGELLEWMRLDEARASRIKRVIPGIGLDDESQWPETQMRMIDTMIRFEKTFRPYIEQITI